MKPILLTLAAATALGSLAAAEAAPMRMRVQPVPSGLDTEEVREYRLEQLERRHEMEQAALQMDQRIDRRRVDPDDDED